MCNTFTIIAPRYQHDCGACRFVGYDGDADVWQSCGGESVIRRFSDEGADYASFPIAIAAQIPSYASAVALVQAIKPLPS